MDRENSYSGVIINKVFKSYKKLTSITDEDAPFTFSGSGSYSSDEIETPNNLTLGDHHALYCFLYHKLSQHLNIQKWGNVIHSRIEVLTKINHQIHKSLFQGLGETYL